MSDGATRIQGAFAAARDTGRAALVPYFVAGRPSIEAMPQLLADAEAAGADLIEIGVPFSDPLADGPVIRNATRRALESGVTVAVCLELVRATRALGVEIPLVLMGYANPILAYGVEQFCADAADAGADGLIVPDVPLEEAHALCLAAERNGVGVTFLVTPLTSDARIEQLANASTGFVYAVATTGTTGARGGLDPRTIKLLDRARVLGGTTPVAVGFGISSADHVRALTPHTDGVIVGSALVALVEQDPSAAISLIGELAAAAAPAAAQP